ncbi:MAG: coenzyme F420 hydrogenase/dehydrogenase beta subunit N-terminal domain-containing protein, partial [Candidatus Syntropharchaeia archaeon]
MYTEQGNISDLEAKVVYNDLCCYCGACGAFCTEYISYENEKPVTKEKCFELHGACFDFCPRTFLPVLDIEREVFGNTRNDKMIGYYTEIFTARAKDEKVLERAQDGGVVSALLNALLDNKMIDAAVVAKNAEGDSWVPEPFVATSSEDVLASAGSKYTQCPSLMGVGDAVRNGFENIALVGLPCHIQAMRKIKLSPHFDVGADKVTLLIGLLCTETFDYDLLKKKLEEMGTKIEDVVKFNIKKGK